MYYKFGIEFDIITRRCQRVKYHAGISPVLSVYVHCMTKEIL